MPAPQRNPMGQGGLEPPQHKGGGFTIRWAHPLPSCPGVRRRASALIAFSRFSLRSSRFARTPSARYSLIVSAHKKTADLNQIGRCAKSVTFFYSTRTFSSRSDDRCNNNCWRMTRKSDSYYYYYNRLFAVVNLRHSLISHISALDPPSSIFHFSLFIHETPLISSSRISLCHASRSASLTLGSGNNDRRGQLISACSVW